jgi:hypothetical protein
MHLDFLISNSEYYSKDINVYNMIRVQETQVIPAECGDFFYGPSSFI